MSDYSKLTVPEIKTRISTIKIGLAILEKDPRFKDDPRYQERVDYYQGEIDKLVAELGKRGEPVTIFAKTVALNVSARSR